MKVVAILVAGTLTLGPTVGADPDDPFLNVEHREEIPPQTLPLPVDEPAAETPQPEADKICEMDQQEQAICDFRDPATPTPDTPAVTPGDVLEETKRIGLPRLRARIQPAGSTLVNLETIFHTTATDFERTVAILDSTVELRARPSAYTWHHGDDTKQVTRRPGRPYPDMDVTHTYGETGRVQARVDVTYTVTYRIDDGQWQTLDTPITAAGPPTPLRVREARPVLTN